ncbi:hypothetical protein C1I95_11120 [Micromonospora craterilacus]|uniref:Uncharacterized protein n=1 Tax=Micromonospora craterilacus TaxID=1655439 RepID=A0A2W2F3R8_9ACTN|nr:hypothetical protein [Micromonospora craterilacus]PZG19658.1 hypothetical protein C1I95_11120 [Micromonospora craterilacus]
MKRSGVALVVAVALVVVAGVVLLRVQRDREWAHGGDAVKAEVEVAIATQETFERLVAAAVSRRMAS